MTRWNKRLWLLARRLFKGDRFSVHGVEIIVPGTIDPEIRYRLARQRRYEEPEARFIGKYLRPDVHVVELGGSIGVMSALIRKRIGRTSRHVIVEANPVLAKVCERNANLGADPGSVCVVVAAIDYSGKPEVYFDPGHNSHTGHVAASGICVSTTTLAHVVAGLPDGPRVLVCDIEGAELDLVAAEAHNLWQFETIILETHPQRYAQGHKSLEDLVLMLKNQSFVPEDIADDVIVFTRRVA